MRRRAKKDDVARAYGDIWDNLSLEQCLLVRGSQIIIPKSYRQAFLNRIHESHRSETDTLRNIIKDFWYSTSPSHHNRATTLLRRQEGEGHLTVFWETLECMDEISHQRQQYFSQTDASPCIMLMFGHRSRGKLLCWGKSNKRLTKSHWQSREQGYGGKGQSTGTTRPKSFLCYAQGQR